MNFDFYGYDIVGLKKITIKDWLEREVWRVENWPNLTYENWPWANGIDIRPFRRDKRIVSIKDKEELSTKSLLLKGKMKMSSSFFLLNKRRAKAKRRMNNVRNYQTGAEALESKDFWNQKESLQKNFLLERWSIWDPLVRPALDQALFTLEWHIQIVSKRPWITIDRNRRKGCYCYFRLKAKEKKAYETGIYDFKEEDLLIYVKGVMVSTICCNTCFI